MFSINRSTVNIVVFEPTVTATGCVEVSVFRIQSSHHITVDQQEICKILLKNYGSSARWRSF